MQNVVLCIRVGMSNMKVKRVLISSNTDTSRIIIKLKNFLSSSMVILGLKSKTKKRTFLTCFNLARLWSSVITTIVRADVPLPSKTHTMII